MRVFLDTNVLVAAFAARGLCEDVFRLILHQHALVVSRHVLDELERTLVRKLGMPPSRTKAVCAFVRGEAEVTTARAPAPWPEGDPDDQWIVGAAIESGVDLLVTGDRDLLDLADEIPVPVASPRQFWQQVR